MQSPSRDEDSNATLDLVAQPVNESLDSVDFLSTDTPESLADDESDIARLATASPMEPTVIDEDVSYRMESQDDDEMINFSLATSELIREATEAAVQDAIAVKSSDSVLSVDSNEEDDDVTSISDSTGQNEKVQLTGVPARAVSRASNRYMEEASVEASMLLASELGGSMSMSKLSLLQESGSSVVRTQSQSSILSSASESQHPMMTLDEYFGVSVQGGEVSANGALTDSIAVADSAKLCPQCGDGESDRECLRSILRSHGFEGLGEEFRDANLLHSIFVGFCTPPIELSSIDAILRREQGESIHNVMLPSDIVVEHPLPVLSHLIGMPLAKIPVPWALALLRVLIRLITNMSDKEYDHAILNSCPWFEETYASSAPDRNEPASRARTSSTSSLRTGVVGMEHRLRSNDTQYSNQTHSVVRLRRNWDAPVSDVLDVLVVLLKDSGRRALLQPVIYILGMLSAAGLTVKELQRMVTIANSQDTPPLPRLLLIRALRIATTNGISRSPARLGKVNPRSFFSFTSGPGIQRVIKLEKTSWPFRNDFGMAVYFRGECFRDTITLLRAVSENGDGTEVTLIPLSKESNGLAKATMLAVSVLEGGKVVETVKVDKCILHERAWYHVAVRHTRSRMKGVFSLAAREQLSVMLDGKIMLTQQLKFPQVSGGTTKSLSLTFGANFDGQTGAVHIFHDNVSDNTLKALFEATCMSSNNGSVPRRSQGIDEWDEHHRDVAKKTRVLDLLMHEDDYADVVLTQRRNGNDPKFRPPSVVDLDDDDELYDPGALSGKSFGSRLYIVWDPNRVEADVAVDVHSGAHVQLDVAKVKPWVVDCLQDVISSIGGVQVVLPVLRKILVGDIEEDWKNEVEKSGNVEAILCTHLRCAAVPESIRLLAALIREHDENLRETLRCGAVDLLEQLFHANKKFGVESPPSPTVSLLSATTCLPSLSRYLVDSLLELRSFSSQYVGLETKVFSQLLFNVPLWFGGWHQGMSLYSELLPFLASVANRNAEKVRDCVGASGMLMTLLELGTLEGRESVYKGKETFERNILDPTDLALPPSREECEHISEVFHGMVFNVFGVGSTRDEVSILVSTLSKYLESEWEIASREVTNGVTVPVRSGERLERFNFIVKSSTSLLLLLQARPSTPFLVENLAAACGSVQGGAAWLLSSMVNSYSDQIRGIGVRCVSEYLRHTTLSPDLPLTLEKIESSDQDSRKGSENRNVSDNKKSLISNVSQGLLNTQVGKGLAAIGPAVRSKLQNTPQLTARVYFKLLWHLLKSHRYRLHDYTHASLVFLVFEQRHQLLNLQSWKEQYIVNDDMFTDCVRVDMGKVAAFLTDASISTESSVRSQLGLKTILRLLRYLPETFGDHWLLHLTSLCRGNVDVVNSLADTPDWQPCLFQFVSELVEGIAGYSLEHSKGGQQSDVTETQKGPHQVNISESVELNARCSRLDSALDLYATLLAHRFRQGGDVALSAMENAASMQRVCINGQEVFLLLLTRLFTNLASLGIVAGDNFSGGDSNMKLKESAKLITDTILSNTLSGISIPDAVHCWRCLRHLIAISVAVVTKLGFGIYDLVCQGALLNSTVDNVSGGLFGIRIEDERIADIRGLDAAQYYASVVLKSGDMTESDKDEILKVEMHRRLCVNISEQILSMLDVFVFPESLDVGLPSSQLHGLTLVRNVESRVGGAQGPLLASLVRLSIVLLSHLEPCSVKLLQCASRLRCFLHWLIELARESEALEGYSSAFGKLTAPFDRLILAVLVKSHGALCRCSEFLALAEAPDQPYFPSKESQKKALKRVLRVSLELREILVTILDRRNDIVQHSLATAAYESLRCAVEGVTLSGTPQNNAQNPVASSKEATARNFLSSGFVSEYRGVSGFGSVTVPDLLLRNAETASTMEDMLVESRTIAESCENSLNGSFENYLETQRLWAETGAVRDLEFEGDTILKKRTSQFFSWQGDMSRRKAIRRGASDSRWNNIGRRTMHLWDSIPNWKISPRTDALGRHTVLVPNGEFSDHADASYELLMGIEREKEEKAREERLRKKEELAELMKRNAEAFVPMARSSSGFEEDTNQEDDTEDCGDDTGGALQDLDYVAEQEVQTELSHTDLATSPNQEDLEAVGHDDHHETDEDAWARAFIWSDSESVVARFESVTLVTLQYMVEGKILLTTHCLYFHPTDAKMNVVTREPVRSESAYSDDDNRRWRLNRLLEVHGRRYMLRPHALELFFSDSQDVFFSFFQGPKERNRFYAKLRNSCKVPLLFSPKSLNPRVEFKKSKLTELWRKRRISNFDYLMALNRMAGRTFNDISQYPVFPWVLSDYSSEKIDLNDSRVYRDLSKPVGALNPDRLSQLLARYNELEQFGFAENEKFLYGSHYSSPGVVLHFLIRQEPFTSMAIDLQSGRFDCPDRLFFDLVESWKSCNTSSSDVKELIPEFFTLPEMFLNTNCFPLGTTQRGRLVDDVGLPPWAKGSAHEFVRIHRLALESEFVSRHLHNWIDLVFGFKQRGVAAEAAHNIFHYLSYEGAVDLDKIGDEVDRKAAESHIQNFGQTPSQLLPKDAHPPRLTTDECWFPLINNLSSTVRLKCHTPARQYGGKKGGCGSAVKIAALLDQVTVVYSDLKIGTFKWNAKASKNRLKPDRLRALPARTGGASRPAIKRGSAIPQKETDAHAALEVGNWSFAITLGGFERETLRKKALAPSRLTSAKDALYTDCSPLVISCGYWDNTVRVTATDSWKLESMESGGHHGVIRCLAMGSDGGFLVTGGEDCTCRVWIVDYPDLAASLSDGYMQTSLGQRIEAESALTACLVLWGHNAPVTCVAVCSELDVVLSGAEDGIVCIHSLRSGEYIRSVRPPSAHSEGPCPVAKIAVDKNGRFVVHMIDCTLHSFSINGRKLCSANAGETIHDMMITGEVLVTGGDRCHVYIRDLNSLKVLSGLDLSRHGPIRTISLTPEELQPSSQHLFIGSDDGMISIVDKEGI